MTSYPRATRNGVGMCGPGTIGAVRRSVRLPIDTPLPAGTGGRLVVIAALAVGGIVAILVPVFFAVAFFGILRG